MISVVAVKAVGPVTPNGSPILFNESTPPETVNELKAVTPPIVAKVVTLPALAERIKLSAPSTVPARVILPAPAPVLKVEAPVRVMGATKLRFCALVVMFELNETPPAPVCAKLPLTEKTAAIFNELLSAIDTGPLAAVVTVFKNENPAPVRTIPVAILVVRGPLNVDTPVPALCAMKPAVIACAETL